ncbi:death-associated protein-like 1-A [Rhincodon typus]|uniref:death-associated protein-like 1-A n=1 Tax=Rhincodon typus TaxID=259920 RepID=UPI00203078DB|nr:death-associated protein-like 1-A [Rhincodon typus]
MGMSFLKNQEENGSDQKTTKYILSSSSAVNLSIRSFILAKTINKLNRKFQPEAMQQKPRPALEKIPLPRQLHAIHQPRKC